MMKATLGQLLINDALPEDMRDHSRVLDKSGVLNLLRELAEKHPEKYPDVTRRLLHIAGESAVESGGMSFGIEHLKTSRAGKKYQALIKQRIAQVLNRDDLTDEQRHELITKAAGSFQAQQMDEVLQESLDEDNPLSHQVLSGSRGNKMNLASLRGAGDLLYSDHHDNVIPLAVMRNYGQGLSPVEYQAGTYGARKGVMATKFATQDAGYLSKQLNQIAHRLMVVGEDYEDDNQLAIQRGFPVDVTDRDSEGSLLARDAGPYKRNMVLTPKMLKHLERLGHKRLLVRSPAVGGSPEGGVYARDVGVRERGTLPGRGEQVGMTAAQAISEKLTDSQLQAKHDGGVAGQNKSLGGFPYINQLIQIPKTFKGGAVHADLDGTVQGVEEAPQGGHYVTVEGKQHYVGRGYDVRVKKGDTVEAGDQLSDGEPNPWMIAHHKGIGEARHYFTGAFQRAMGTAGLKANRRNVELLSRGLINHVRLTEEMGSHVMDDIIPYSTLEHTYEPREGHVVGDPHKAAGHYLEQPVLHYTIGTKLRPSVLKTMKEFGVKQVTTHRDPPPFVPEMIRGMANLHHDPDWMTRFYGSGLKSSLLDSVHRGGSSTPMGTSFVPGLARAVDFGRQGLVRQPEPGTMPEDDDMAKKKPPMHALDLSSIKPKSQGFTFKPRNPESEGLHALSTSMAQEKAARALIEKIARELDPTGSSGTGGESATQAAGPKPKSTGFPGSPETGSTADAAREALPEGSASGGAGTQPAKPPTGQPADAPTPNTPSTMTNGQPNYMQNAAKRQGPLASRASASQVASYVNQGADDDPSQGVGGAMGAAVRYGAALDPRSMSILTRGARKSQAPAMTGDGMPSLGGVVPPESQAANPSFSLGQAAMAVPTLAPNMTAKGLTALAGKFAPGTVMGKALPTLSKGIAPALSVGGKTLSKAAPYLSPILDAADTLGINPIGERYGKGMMSSDEAADQFANMSGDSAGMRAFRGAARGFFEPVQTTYGMGSLLTQAAPGALDSTLGMVGMDQTSRHNRYVASDAGKAEMKQKAYTQGNKIHQHNVQQALAQGHGVMGPDGRLHPSEAWKAQFRQHSPGVNPDEMESRFLGATFGWNPAMEQKTPDQLWSEWAARQGGG